MYMYIYTNRYMYIHTYIHTYRGSCLGRPARKEVPRKTPVGWRGTRWHQCMSMMKWST